LVDEGEYCYAYHGVLLYKAKVSPTLYLWGVVRLPLLGVHAETFECRLWLLPVPGS
jgi:hypothetical protein